MLSTYRGAPLCAQPVSTRAVVCSDAPVSVSTPLLQWSLQTAVLEGATAAEQEWLSSWWPKTCSQLHPSSILFLSLALSLNMLTGCYGLPAGRVASLRLCERDNSTMRSKMFKFQHKPPSRTARCLPGLHPGTRRPGTLNCSSSRGL